MWYLTHRYKQLTPGMLILRPNYIFIPNIVIERMRCSCTLGLKSFILASIFSRIFVSIVVSIPACHAGDRGSIPRQNELF